jgi:serine/threonine-protein kinase
VVVDLFETDQHADSLIGRKLDGRYEVLGRLGEGGVGVVYRGKQVHLGREVAIKVLHKDAAVIPEWRRRFEREAQALSALAHPNVVPVTDSGIDNGVPFLVMELLQGKTLADLLKEGPMPLWRGLDIARQTLRGLAFAHGKGIVHRDLKPANVFLQQLPDQADHVRLLDFGMVKFLEKSESGASAETLTRAGVVFGTPAYLSPEQAKGGPADARTDVYAMGCVLFQLLSGRRPFTEDTYEGVVMAHLTQPVPALAKVRPGLAVVASFQMVVEKAMAKKPSARFKDADAMLSALEAVIHKLPDSALKAGRRKATPRPLRMVPARSSFFRRALLVVAVAAGLGATAATWLRGRHEHSTSGEVAMLPAEPRPKKAPRAQPAPPAPKPAPPAAPPPTTAAPPPHPAAPVPAAPTASPTPSPTAPTPTKPEPAAPGEAHASAEKEAPAEEPDEADLPKVPKARDSAAAPRTRARNPWKEPVPSALRSIRDRVNRNLHMSQKSLQPLYDFAHKNPSDARPWLLLGRAYAQTDWYSDSVDRYVRAYRVDSTCRGDPQMLADLLKGAAHPTAGRAAARAVRDIYGAEAIPALEKTMKVRANEKEAIARLTRLRESLPR